MIFPFFFAGTSPLLQVTDPVSNEIWITAVAPLPELGSRDRAAVEVMARALPRQTQEYNRTEMQTITDGRTVQCQVLSDCVYIRFAVPKGSGEAGLGLMDSLLRRANLADDQIERAKGALAATDRGYWAIALDPTALDFSRLHRADVLDVYTRIFDPAKVQVAVGSSAVDPALVANWASRTEEWSSPKPPRYPDDSPYSLVDYGPTGVSLVELSSPEFPGSDPALPTRLLALTALGSGKGSSLHRIARERHGWSYRQEPVLWPTVKGWQSRFLFPMKNTSEASARALQVQKELREDVQAWTEADRVRAANILESSLVRGLNLCPLNVGPQGSPGMDLADRTFMAAYWPIKTGRSWNPFGMVSAAKMVSLAELKEEASKVLSQMKPRVISGR